ncbi:MAG: hypothetical protein K6L76_10685 [Agarilytica sp.]
MVSTAIELPLKSPHDDVMTIPAIKYPQLAASVYYPQQLSNSAQKRCTLWLLHNTGKTNDAHNNANRNVSETANPMATSRTLSFNNRFLLLLSIVVSGISAGFFGSIAANQTKALMLDGTFKFSFDSFAVMLWVLFGLCFLAVLTSSWALVVSFLQQGESDHSQEMHP